MNLIEYCLLISTRYSLSSGQLPFPSSSSSCTYPWIEEPLLIVINKLHRQCIYPRVKL